MKKIKIFIILFLLFFAIGVRAEGVSVSPSVIDEKSKAKDILKYVVKIKNEKAVKVEMYAILYDILSDGSRAILPPSELDRKNSITKWSSIKRGLISLNPGEEKEFSLEIDVDMMAIPGNYHAVIAFSEGSNRSLAENGAESAPQILVNIEVDDQIIEKAQIENFTTTKNVFTRYPAVFNLQIKNNGNAVVMPRGEIIIYNRRNQQVGQIDVNSLSKQIEKDKSENFEIKWTNEGKGFGKFKAKLEAEYGSKSRRDLQDTIYFWVFPTRYLIFFGFGLFFVTFLMTYLLFKKSRHAKHMHHVGEMDEGEYEDEDEEDGVINLKNE